MEIKTCKECSYFRAHFEMDENGQSHLPPNTGRCTYNNMSVTRFRRCMKFNCPCSNWTPVKNNSPQENINDIIKAMAKRIDEITMALNLK